MTNHCQSSTRLRQSFQLLLIPDETCPSPCQFYQYEVDEMNSRMEISYYAWSL